MDTLEITLPVLVNPMTYQQYRNLAEQLVAQEKTTGEEQSEQKIAFTKLNKTANEAGRKTVYADPGIKSYFKRK